MTMLFEAFFSYLQQWFFSNVVNWLVDLFDVCIQLLQNSFFDHSFVSGLLRFFEVVGGLMLAVGFLKRLISEAEKQMHGEGGVFIDQFWDLIKAYALLLFCRPAVLSSHELMVYLADLITSNFYVAPGRLNGITLNAVTSSLFEILIVIVAIVCTIIMLLTILRQYVILLVQILTGYLYVFDVAAGNSNAIAEWGRDMIGARIAFSLQLVFYEFGITELATSFTGGGQLVVAGVALLGASIVPTVLKRWGYANQNGGGALGRFASTAAMVLPRMVGA